MEKQNQKKKDVTIQNYETKLNYYENAHIHQSSKQEDAWTRCLR